MTVLELLLTEHGQLDTAYCCLQPLEQRRQNVLHMLGHHLNHSSNAAITAPLLECAAKIGTPAVRLLRVLCARLFNDDKYLQQRRIARGAYAEVRPCCAISCSWTAFRMSGKSMHYRYLANTFTSSDFVHLKVDMSSPESLQPCQEECFVCSLKIPLIHPILSFSSKTAHLLHLSYKILLCAQLQNLIPAFGCTGVLVYIYGSWPPRRCGPESYGHAQVCP